MKPSPAGIPLPVKYPSALTDQDVATVILAGGEGTRLFPLTSMRCKPAVTFGGRYRIIDIPIANSLMAKSANIYVISQFLASTLNNYLAETYTPEHMQPKHLEILGPEETPLHQAGYLGTADSVRKNLRHILNSGAKYFFILSGDQVYWMDLNEMLQFAIEKDADVTIATIVSREKEARRMGVMQIGSEAKITDFYEKPQTDPLLDRFRIRKHIAHYHDKLNEGSFLGSMGIYLFKREALIKLLHDDPREDFGKHIIPTSLTCCNTFAYIFDGYWEDIGTIASFYEANMKIVSGEMCLDLYSPKHPIFAHNRSLPSPKIVNTLIKNAIVCDGSVIEADLIEGSMIGAESHIGKHTRVVRSIILGNNRNTDFSSRPSTIGSHCYIEKAIIDEGCSIGNNVTLVNTKNLDRYDSEKVVIRDGIIILRAGTKLDDNYELFAA
ncbi:MAG: hypothetical protein A3F09_01910 [Chlamydiae bacterium RIFCSPHIGHO2_12_FULL_49_11]|nr:MAG: hypothetical protein A3F09_01910 [Chlamydiae bacterium RIFCSPHIGHO2_12_FULL_49_11]